MFARTKGFALAMATLLVSSIGLALSSDRSPFECGGSCAEPEPSFSLFETLFSMGFIPCALAGVPIGAFAGALAHVPPLRRWLALAFLSGLFVAMMASAARLPDYALVSMIPTLAAVTALERATRAPPVPPAVPPARAEPAYVVMPTIPAFEIAHVAVTGTRVAITGIGQDASAAIAGDQMTFDGGFGAHRASPDRAAELDRIVSSVQAACDRARTCYRAAVAALGIENREAKDFGPLLRTGACSNIITNLVDDLQEANKTVPGECAVTGGAP